NCTTEMSSANGLLLEDRYAKNRCHPPVRPRLPTSEQQPDIVICTHFLPAEIVSWLRTKKKIAAWHAIVVTDFDVVGDGHRCLKSRCIRPTKNFKNSNPPLIPNANYSADFAE